METMTSVLVLALILIPLMTFFPTALSMMSQLFGMSTALVGMPF
ncbi:Hypothetical protein NGAL_HAMBI2605_29280 [Neorhizobium galegae bv. orientalis]|nr:Hypothetical protein NGAL_HAMBI2566_11690 [Neorhizobium galegae bv. orientalis]CDZ64332.1 Hypothetical protein NGAL_HAMBI2605_29280 [Neorhizobium galegae bv. orientalis]